MRHSIMTSRRARTGLLALTASLTLASCSWSDLVSSDLPPTTADPDAIRTEEGALAVYRGAIWAFRRGFGGGARGYVVAAGLMTDELVTVKYLGGASVPAMNDWDELDSRDIPEDQVLRSNSLEAWYRDFNMARNQTVDAIYYLRNFAPFLSPDLIGHMYAIRGYSMLYLADVFCSGVPLTEYTLGGFEYEDGISTEALYERAIVQFDSALASVPDSARFRHLAKVGKARALLNLGRQSEAAVEVAEVPTSFKYEALFANDRDGSFSNNWTWRIRNTTLPENNSFGTIGDREGTNGLPFVSANDPRVPLIRAPQQSNVYPNTIARLPAWMFPNDAIWRGTSPEPKNAEDIVVASGIEARLIEAEAAAAAGGANFLTILNTLRTSCTSATCATPAPAGTGGVTGLPPLTDPGTRDARIKLVMDERAYWMFLTGQRQGDLRRMVRVYDRSQAEVYPVGDYPMGVKKAYGDFTNLPIPHTERAINPKYTGCIDRDA